MSRAVVRLSTASNPLGLQLGERVRTIARATVEYQGTDTPKKVLIREVREDRPCVTGVVKKALGTYHRGCDYNGLWGEDYVPPYLEVSSYVRLYECRVSLEDKPFLVHPDDIEVLEDE